MADCKIHSGTEFCLPGLRMSHHQRHEGRCQSRKQSRGHQGNQRRTQSRRKGSGATKRTFLTVVGVFLFLSATWAKTPRMDQRRDAPLQTTWITPHNPPDATEQEGSILFGNSYQWLVYPYIGISFDGSRQWFQLAIELRGNGDALLNPGRDLTFTVDGKLYTMSDIFAYNVGGGRCGQNVLGDFRCVGNWEIAPNTPADRWQLESLVQLISKAHEVYVTFAGGAATNRMSVRLTESQLAVFQAVYAEYQRRKWPLHPPSN